MRLAACSSRTLASLGFALALSACHHSLSEPDGCPLLERLGKADARADAQAAAQNGDRHLVMLGGYVGAVPGGEHSALRRVLLAGTEDTASSACQARRGIAEAYARAYNEATVALSAAPGRR